LGAISRQSPKSSIASCAAFAPPGARAGALQRRPARRRLYGRYLSPVSGHEKRIAEIESGKFDAEIEGLKKADKKVLRDKYAAREMEPALEQEWE
jgi:hypothetical protein